MNENAILIPALSLVGWTLLVLLLVPYRRFRAAFAGQVSARDFKFGESERVPPDVSIPNRNFMNLLEAPVLFYVVCVIAYVTHNADAAAVNLAWELRRLARGAQPGASNLQQGHAPAGGLRSEHGRAGLHVDSPPGGGG